MTYKQIEFAREIRMWIKDIRNFIRNKMDKKNKFTTVK